MSSSTGNHHHNNRIVNDLGKRLLEAARQGDTDEVSRLMSNGAPLTTDWVSYFFMIRDLQGAYLSEWCILTL